MFGPICGETAQPPIHGPHMLVRLSGMGDDHFPADTRSAEAQAWFDYGLTLARSFEHADAILAFQRSEAIDPSCSLCVWGEAWARGPTINFPVPPDQIAQNLVLARRALALRSPRTTPVMRALETALADRYRASDASAGDLAFAREMDVLNGTNPQDAELAIFDAEAWLIRERDGDRSELRHAVSVLQPLLQAHGDSSGLLHFFVHATEEAGEPELAEPYAARVAELAPNASHMVHMPSHTFYRVGRYEAAARANLAALRADRAYAEKTDFPTPLGGMLYHFHDVQFGVAAAMMSGDGVLALEFVRRFNQDFPDPAAYDTRAEMAGGMAWAAYGRFASPRRVLAAPDRVSARPLLEALRHYARGEADLRLGRSSAARKEAESVVVPGDASTVVMIARLVLSGQANMLDHDPARAEAAFRTAASLQDTKLTQIDPPRWWFPVRRSLAASLLSEGDYAGAEREAASVLRFWKLDPVTLEIRARAERALGQTQDAAKNERTARRFWRGKDRLADVIARAG